MPDMAASPAAASATELDALRGEGPAVFRVAQLAGQLRRLGVRPGGVLLVHSAFRSIRPVEGGPLGLVAALREALGPRGTLVMPSMTGDDDLPFDRDTTPAATALGIVPELFRRQPGVLRSGHFAAFAAIGPEARRIVAAPLTHPPSAPGSAIDLVRRLDGQVLLLGVGHECDTMLHLAEIIGGAPYRVPRHYTACRDGRPVTITYGENDHCCRRFALADRWLRAAGAQSEGPVGHAHARLADARDLVEAAASRLRRDPLLFLHAPGACPACDEAWESVAGRAELSRRSE